MLRKTGRALAVAVILLSGPAFARPQRGGARGFGHPREGRVSNRGRRVQTPIDRFEEMPPEAQRRALNQLPLKDRQRVEEQLRKFNSLPEEQQAALKNLYSRLHQLPPKQENAAHEAIARFSELPMDRQEAVKEQLRALAPLPEADRDSQLKSKGFRQGLNRKEQGIVKNMLPLFTSN